MSTNLFKMLQKLTVIAVCTGNICRSPMAEVILSDALSKLEPDALVSETSAGTIDLHSGDDMDPRARSALTSMGYRPGRHKAHKLTEQDLTKPLLLLALDETHATWLRQFVVGTPAYDAEIHLLMSLSDQNEGTLSVPDPYFGTQSDFQNVGLMIQRAMPGVVRHIGERLG